MGESDFSLRRITGTDCLNKRLVWFLESKSSLFYPATTGILLYLGNELLGAATQLDVQQSVVRIPDGRVAEPAQTCRNKQHGGLATDIYRYIPEYISVLWIRIQIVSVPMQYLGDPDPYS